MLTNKELGEYLEKIRKQKELLEWLGKDEAKLLSQYIEQIAWNDETNREGHSAKVYFNAIFGLDFTRTQDNLINAALNYGYSIIRLPKESNQ